MRTDPVVIVGQIGIWGRDVDGSVLAVHIKDEFGTVFFNR